MSNADTLKKLQAYKDHAKTEGEELVKNVFPKRVFEMEELLKSSQFTLSGKGICQEINIPLPGNTLSIAANDANDDGSSQCKRIRVDDGVKGLIQSRAALFPAGLVPINSKIECLIQGVKPRLTRLMDEAQQVRLWITFNIPRIEDGNNFGVGIQEEVLQEASAIERDACTFLDQISRYYASRGKLIAKVAKYPHIEDFRECIRDVDEKEAITLRYIIMEIRNHYAALHDLINKNLERIKIPRSDNSVNLY